jgi:hypothetical protein
LNSPKQLKKPPTRASRINIQPGIMGTLFERAWILKKAASFAQLGAHYTSEADIKTPLNPSSWLAAANGPRLVNRRRLRQGKAPAQRDKLAALQKKLAASARSARQRQLPYVSCNCFST